MAKSRATRDPKTGRFKSRSAKPRAKRVRDQRTGKFVSRDPFAAGIPPVFRREVRF